MMRYILKEFKKQDLQKEQEKVMKEMRQKEKEMEDLRRKLGTLMEMAQALRSEE